VAHNYDVILLDSPPALGMISVNVLMAADALLVPSRRACLISPARAILPNGSQLHWPAGCGQELSLDIGSDYVVRSRYESQKQFFEVMRACFGESVFQRVFFHSSAVINSAAQFVTPMNSLSLIGRCWA